MSLRFGKHIGFTCELKLMPASLFEATLMIEMSLLYGPNRHENAKKLCWNCHLQETMIEICAYT